jgi:aryl-alcohol dehydrogenase-like predicted oxidoreductase
VRRAYGEGNDHHHEGIPVQQRLIGPRSVSAIGLGGMPMSIEGRPDTERSVATIHAALDAGVTLIAEALRSYGGDTSHVLVATKGGHVRPGDGSWTLDGRPEHLEAAAKASAQRLGVDAIGLYQFHRPDPKVPYADSVGALRDLLDEGAIQLAGISNATVEQIDLANEILGGRLVSIQNQFSPTFTSSRAELDHCAELGIAFLPWSPLGGIGRTASVGDSHPAFRRIADERGVSLQQVILAWELALAPVVIPIPGSSRPVSITDSLRAADLELTPDDLTSLSSATTTTTEQEHS